MSDSTTKTASSVFNATNLRFGLAADFSNFTLADAPGDPVIFSNDATSSFPPSVFKVTFIAALKVLIGDDSANDHGVAYPTAFSTVDQQILTLASDGKPYEQLMTKDVADNIDVAYSAYLIGVASKLGKYEDLLNALYFPLQVAYFASDSGLTINKQITVVGDSQVVINTTDVTFATSDSITVNTQFTLTCNTMSK
jgi:hypothetical protein